MSMHIISALVEDNPGVLNRISGMFTRRCININSLTVSPCEKKGLSRMTIATIGDDRELEKAVKQLDRLVEVVKVSILHKSSSIVRDMCLVRISAADTKKRGEAMQIVGAYGAKTVDVSLSTLTAEIADDPRKVDKFIEIMGTFGIRQMFRTGITAIDRDDANGNGVLK